MQHVQAVIAATLQKLHQKEKTFKMLKPVNCSF